MNSSMIGSDNQTTKRKRLPLSGVVMVFRHQMRGRNALRDLAGTALLLAAILAVAAFLQVKWEQTGLYSGAPETFLLRWLLMGALAETLILLPCAAVLGASAVPAAAEFEVTQSMLLTDLTAFEIMEGRLLAGLWPLISTVLASCAFWLAAQLGWHMAAGSLHGFGPILAAHFTMLCAISMVSALGFLFATRRRPGRVWGRGAAFAFGWTTLCVLAIFLANPQIRRMNDPTKLIEGALLINPVSAVMTAYSSDILRAPLLYDRTTAHDYDFAYPSPFASAAAFALIGLSAKALAAMRLRRAYR